MADVTRRGFLAQTAIATGVGIAGGLGLHQFVLPRNLSSGRVANSPAAAAATNASPMGMVSGATALTSMSAGGLSLVGPMVVHVRDLVTAEISVMVGSQEFVYRDPELVARLVKSAGSAMAEG